MMQIGKLNRRLSATLRGRKIVDDRKEQVDLTDDEVFLIEKAISQKTTGASISTIYHISKRCHLDFIGWDNEEYMDVLLCSST